MKAVQDRRRAFALVDMSALDRIDVHVSRGDRKGVAHMYLTLCRVATVEFAARERVFEATRALLMEKGSVSENTLDKHIAELERLGLVEVERHGGGKHGGNRYALLDSPTPEAPPTHRNACPPATVAGGNDCRGVSAAGGQPLPGDPGQPLGAHSRVRVNAVEEKKEERGREGERASEPLETGAGGEHSDIEQAVGTAFEALLSQRGRKLTASERLAIRGAIAAAPDDIDLVAVVGRLERNYGPDGKAARQPIGSPVGLFCEEIRRSTATRPDTERPARRSRPRRPGNLESGRRQAAARWEQDRLTVRSTRRGIEAPGRHLASAWQAARSWLEENGARGQWDLMDSLNLAGETFFLVDEAGGDTDQVEKVIVLEALPSQLEHTAAMARRAGVVQVLERALGAENIVVELVAAPIDVKPSVAA